MKRVIATCLLCMLLVLTVSAQATNEIKANAEPAHRTLVLGLEKEPATLNSHANAENIVLQMGHLYAGFLTSLNPQNGGPILPAVASSWKYISEKELAIQLREDVYFHNGRKLTADDIVFTFNWTMDQKNASIRRTNFIAFFDKAVKTGEFSVTLHLKSPYPSLLELLAYLPIIAEDTVGTLNTAPIGCGPFKFVRWDANQQIVFVPYEKYYDYESIQFDELICRPFQDYNAAMTAFFADEVDIMLFLNTADIPAINSRGNKYYVQSISDTGNYVSCNTAKEKLANPKVREAIKYAIDKKELIDLLQSGVGLSISQMYAPSNMYYVPALDWDKDLVRAKMALVDAGYPNGLDIEILTPNTSARVNLATVLKEQLGKVGFRVTINVQENAAMFELFNAGKADLAIGGFGFYADPSFRTMFISSTANSNWRRYGYNDKEYNDLYMEGLSSTDTTRRKEIYARMAQKAIDEAGFFMLYSSTSNCAVKSNIEGLVYRGSGNSDFTHITFKK